MKASDLIGRTAYDAAGTELGRVVDLLTRPDAQGQPRVYAALVTPGHRGRLFGYERDGIQGPWLLEQFARWLHRGTREVPWAEVQLTTPDAAASAGR